MPARAGAGPGVANMLISRGSTLAANVPLKLFALQHFCTQANCFLLVTRWRGEGSLGVVTRKSQKAAFSVLKNTQTQAERDK